MGAESEQSLLSFGYRPPFSGAARSTIFSLQWSKRLAHAFGAMRTSTGLFRLNQQHIDSTAKPLFFCV